MNLLRADKEILMDCTRQQQSILSKQLLSVKDRYSYIIIDNAPDLNMCVINGLVACDDVMIPIKIDKFAFDGLHILREQIEDIKEFNKNIKIAGCFVTMFQKNNVNIQGLEHLKSNLGLKIFNSYIRKTVKVDESTFAGKPLYIHSKKCTATKDYIDLVSEYLDCASN